METLGDALPKEMARVRELIVRYRDPELKGAGNLAAAMMELSLQQADAAVTAAPPWNRIARFGTRCMGPWAGP